MVQKQPSCDDGDDEGLKSLIPMKPLFASSSSETRDTAGKEHKPLCPKNFPIPEGIHYEVGCPQLYQNYVGPIWPLR